MPLYVFSLQRRLQSTGRLRILCGKNNVTKAYISAAAAAAALWSSTSTPRPLPPQSLCLFISRLKIWTNEAELGISLLLSDLVSTSIKQNEVMFEWEPALITRWVLFALCQSQKVYTSYLGGGCTNSLKHVSSSGANLQQFLELVVAFAYEENCTQSMAQHMSFENMWLSVTVEKQLLICVLK